MARRGLSTQALAGAVIVVIGVFLLLSTTGAYGVEELWRYVPSLFVLLGVWALYRSEFRNVTQRWATNAAVLVVVLSRTTYEGSDDPLRNGSFSTGASWENLALEGTRRGLAVHPIQGFDADAARTVLDVPDDLRVEIMTAIGVRGSRDVLSDHDREREYPSGRKPLFEIVTEGGFAR